MKPFLIACLTVLMMAPPAFASAPSPAGSPHSATADAHVQLARFGGFRSRGFGTRPRYGSRYGYRRGRGRGIFRSIIRALAIGYLLHLLFTTPGGNILLLFMIIGIVLLFMRLRRRTMLRY